MMNINLQIQIIIDTYLIDDIFKQTKYADWDNNWDVLQFFIKVPFHLTSYQLKLKFRLIHKDMLSNKFKIVNLKYTNGYANINGVHSYNHQCFDDFSKFNIISMDVMNGITWNTQYTQIFNVTFPSFVAPHDYQFLPKESALCVFSNCRAICTVIGQESNNNSFLVEYKSWQEQKEYVMPRTHMFRPSYPTRCVIDTCNQHIDNRLNLECSLVLQAQDDEIHKYYAMLRCVISNNIYKRGFDNLNHQINIESNIKEYHVCNQYNFDYIAGFLSCIVMKYVGIDLANYDQRNHMFRMGCLSNCDHKLSHDNRHLPLWNFIIREEFENVQNMTFLHWIVIYVVLK